MAKNRLCDVEIWQKDWFLNLSDKQKLLCKFLFDNCDCAGFYQISWRLLKIYFNSEITKEDFLQIKQVKFLNDNLIFIEDFVLFQYKIRSYKELKPKNKAHLGALRLLKKYGIFEYEKQSPLEGASKPLESPLEGVQEKEKEKEWDKEKDKEQEKEKEIFKTTFYSTRPHPDLMFDSEVNKIYEIYKENCPNLIPVGFGYRDLKKRQKIKEFLNIISGDFDYFKQVCIKANKLKVIANNKIDIDSVINNHIGIFNDKYQVGEEPIDFQAMAQKIAERMEKESKT